MPNARDEQIFREAVVQNPAVKVRGEQVFREAVIRVSTYANVGQVSREALVQNPAANAQAEQVFREAIIRLTPMTQSRFSLFDLLLLAGHRRPCLFSSDGSSLTGWTHSGVTVQYVIDGTTTSGVFNTGETVVQTGTGANFTEIQNLGRGGSGHGPGYDLGSPWGVYHGPLVASSITGVANDFGTWVGQTSGAIYTPSSVPTPAFYVSGGAGGAMDTNTGHPVTSLTLQFMLELTDYGNENWQGWGFGCDSTGHGPNLQLVQNFGNQAQLNVGTAFFTYAPVGGSIVSLSISKNVWHTLKMTVDGSGNTDWFLDSTHMDGPTLLEPAQGDYIGWGATYGNTWITDICTK